MGLREWWSNWLRRNEELKIEQELDWEMQGEPEARQHPAEGVTGLGEDGISARLAGETPEDIENR
jgi:hypothetical protein